MTGPHPTPGPPSSASATNPPPGVQTDPDEGLVRAIGLGSAVLLVVGAVVGSGIFLTTGVMASHLPSVTLLLVAWVAGGILALAGGLTYAEMGSMYPRSGGLYAFLTEAYGPLTRPVESVAGLGLVALGLPFYWYWRKEIGHRVRRNPVPIR